ncbi:hypothetical protein QBC35DRAFT_478158 [Podospora australis]|uniref:C2H2-type domain-containing protein n=1 Tax=Podospora australis TaxID=1536484 RepID=A0AAN7ACD6_9PEZI|nr:hypothetical protein QBC35DRAFT_478158 [Podospora australis]
MSKGAWKSEEKANVVTALTSQVIEFGLKSPSQVEGKTRLDYGWVPSPTCLVVIWKGQKCQHSSPDRAYVLVDAAHSGPTHQSAMPKLQRADPERPTSCPEQSSTTSQHPQNMDYAPYIWKSYYHQNAVLASLWEDEDSEAITAWISPDVPCIDPELLNSSYSPSIQSCNSIIPLGLHGSISQTQSSTPNSCPPSSSSDSPSSDTGSIDFTSSSSVPPGGINNSVAPSTPEDLRDATPKAIVYMSPSPSMPMTSGDVEGQLTDIPQLDQPSGLLPSPSKQPRFPCPVPNCGRAFTSPKDLRRHLDSIQHADPSGGKAFFRCRCGKLSPRKDNHDRHVRKCRHPTQSPFRCRCGHETTSALHHLAHAQQ